jgi:selT/selW/selH-like putative selenoprotein
MKKEFGAEAFTFTLKRDAERTGNFEVEVNGTQVHSKKASGKFPNADWGTYMEAVKPLMK